MSVDPQLASFFQAVDSDRSGRINPSELQSVLQSSNGRKFSESACRLMIGLFDPTSSGSIDVNGFAALYNYVNQWLGTFKNFDRNGSGFIDEGECGQSLQSMGYRFSPVFVSFLMSKFGSPPSGLPVDGFISACILIHKFTEGFRKKDTAASGVISIGYEDFLQVVLEGWS